MGEKRIIDSTSKNQSGFTLIELLFSIVMCGILSGTLIIIYLSSQKNLSEQSAWQTVHSNGLAASQILKNAILTAGFMGCAKFPNDQMTRVQTFYHSSIKSGTDAIQIKQADPMSVTVQNGDYFQLLLKGESSFSANDTVVISDCMDVDIATIIEVKQTSNGQLILFSKALSKIFTFPAEISFFHVNSYFVMRTDRIDKNGEPIDALYFQNGKGQKFELVEGVNDMKIQYGVIENNQLKEKNAQDISDWVNVKSVVIMLELKGLNEAHIKQREYFAIQLRE